MPVECEWKTTWSTQCDNIDNSFPVFLNISKWVLPPVLINPQTMKSWWILYLRRIWDRRDLFATVLRQSGNALVVGMMIRVPFPPSLLLAWLLGRLWLFWPSVDQLFQHNFNLPGQKTIVAIVMNSASVTNNPLRHPFLPVHPMLHHGERRWQ